ncbi:LamB/YcsF family protein [Fodinicola acaciae]|uniref:LamB/YcsF family protein n=1 Tax=Fodinicola acaciae TaxID=2681555 RepID=UPI0013D6D5CC|nr:LamB/YcsF family protein [Fodinicola acaciae]
MDVTIDLNCDLPSDEPDMSLLGVVTSVSVPCCWQSGEPGVLRRICAAAAASGVALGAQISCGRRDEVLYRLGGLDALARAAGTRIRYVRPGGPLRAASWTDAAAAYALVEAVRLFDPDDLTVLCAAGSQLWLWSSQAGLPTATEAYADRAYASNGQLLPEDEPGAVLRDARTIAARAVAIATAGRVPDHEGRPLPMPARSIHLPAGDLPARVRDELAGAGVRIADFTADGD